MMVVKALLFVMFLILALLFAYYNIQSVKISFFKYSLEVPLFLSLLSSFVLGFLLSYVTLEIRGAGPRRYGERLRSGLRKLWTGYYSGAQKDISKVLDNEEVVPLYVRVLRKLGREPYLYLQKYNLGIVETELALEVFKREPERAKNLLEKALGKSWDNLEARRLLRGIYFLTGEVEKTLDLQRSLIRDAEKELRDEEKRVLASLLAEIEGEKATEEIEKLPPTPASLALMARVKNGRRKKVLTRAFDLGVQNEVILIMVERGDISPELMELVEERRSSVNPLVLALLYGSVGMVEKLEELKDELESPIKTLIERRIKEERECYGDMVSLLRPWECGECGKEHGKYSPLCGNCLSWNKLKVKGGS